MLPSHWYPIHAFYERLVFTRRWHGKQHSRLAVTGLTLPPNGQRSPTRLNLVVFYTNASSVWGWEKQVATINLAHDKATTYSCSPKQIFSLPPQCNFMITFKIRFQTTKWIFSLLPVSSKHLSNNAANNLKQNVNSKRYYCHKERHSLSHTTQNVFIKSLHERQHKREAGTIPLTKLTC